MRKRDSQTRKVVVLETRYETDGEPASAASDLGALSASLSSLDVAEGSEDAAYHMGPGLSSSASFGRSYEDSDDPYAWAQRLRDIPDKVSFSPFLT